MKFVKSVKTIFFIAILSITSISFASENYASANEMTEENDYDANYYEDTTALLFKIRGFYMRAPSKLESLPKPQAGTSAPSFIAQNGFGFDTSTTYFFNNNLAAEVSLGLARLQLKNSLVNEFAKAFGTDPASSSKNNIFLVPLAITAQYHIAPFGAIRPYVGAGYHATYMHLRSKAMKVSSGHGAVLQAGVDIAFQDDTFFTLDIKQYFLRSNLTFKKDFLSPGIASAASVKSRVKWDPLVISLGFGFKL
ncbi:MAG: hypothetical protein COA94_00670 [Rickettsiales bacterium]|nr:MAG: hypothetical protein COA94_00670 [Rickettsiales bacterium]